jgi:serine/threonine protein phosphatase PrpC
MKFESTARKLEPIKQPKPEELDGAVELSDADLEEVEELSSDVLEDELEELGDADFIKEGEEKSGIVKKGGLKSAEAREAGPKFIIGAATEASPEHPERNEDANFSSPGRGIIGVFDGMGGVPAGDFASAAAANELTRGAIDRKLKDAKTPAEAATAELIKKVFDAPKETAQTQDDVENATRAMLQRMNDEVEQLGKTNPVVQQKGVEYFNKNLKSELGEYDANDERHRRMLARVLGTVGTTASFMKMWRSADGKDRMTIGQIGDSRIYRLRNGKLEQMSKDDSHINVLIEEGVTDINGNPLNDQDVDQQISKQTILDLADKRPELQQLVPSIIRKSGPIKIGDIRNVVTQAIGLASQMKDISKGKIEFKPQVRTEEMQDGDLYLNVGDGVSDNLTDAEIQEILLAHKDNPQQASEELQKAATLRSIKGKDANARAKKDDVTALIASYQKG